MAAKKTKCYSTEKWEENIYIEILINIYSSVSILSNQNVIHCLSIQRIIIVWWLFIKHILLWIWLHVQFSISISNFLDRLPVIIIWRQFKSHNPFDLSFVLFLLPISFYCQFLQFRTKSYLSIVVGKQSTNKDLLKWRFEAELHIWPLIRVHFRLIQFRVKIGKLLFSVPEEKNQLKVSPCSQIQQCWLILDSFLRTNQSENFLVSNVPTSFSRNLVFVFVVFTRNEISELKFFDWLKVQKISFFFWVQTNVRARERHKQLYVFQQTEWNSQRKAGS